MEIRALQIVQQVAQGPKEVINAILRIKTAHVAKNALVHCLQPSSRLKAMNKCILCYVGSLNPQDGDDYLLRSLRYLLHDLKRSDFHCVIMGTGDSLQDLRHLAGTLQLNGCVELTGFIP